MGNAFARDPNELNFKGIHTENFNSEIPYLNKLQNDSRILAENLSNNLNNSENNINNRKMYNMFNEQQSENNFSDTSPLVDTNDITNSATSVANTEIKQLLSKIQNGGSLEDYVNNNNEPVNFINTDAIQQLLTETSGNQRGGNLNETFVNEDMIRNLLTETNEQTGGFFWNKTPQNETFINEETFKNLVENNNDPNATSEINTEFNNYMNNAITELTSALENQKGGGESESEEEEKSSSSESPTMVMKDDMMDEVLEEESPMADVPQMGQNSNGRNGYTSSSAHSNEIDSINSNMSSTASATVSAGNDKYLSDSINTSDINMISVE